MLLLWIYYSGLIFYFGAEFTKSYSDRYGSRLKLFLIQRLNNIEE